MKPPAKGIYDPAAVRGGPRVPAYVWTGHQQQRGRVIRPTGIRPNWHVILTVSGDGSFRQPGFERRFVPGDLILFTPDCYQDYGPVQPGGTWENIFIHFAPRPHWHGWMRWPLIAPGLSLVHLTDGPLRSDVMAALLRCDRYAHAAFSTFAHELALSALEEAILIGAHEATYGGRKQRRTSGIAAVVEAITGNLVRRFTITEMARIAGLSASRFSHLFKEEIGESAIAYSNRLRVREAARLLEAEGLTVKEVAAAVGFESPFYFSRQFKRYYLIDPSGFRRHAASLPRRDAPVAP
jgi:AraC family transcriptional regulator of arabinose operon